MIKIEKYFTAVVVLILLTISTLTAQKRTVGLIRNLPGAFDGFTLFTPMTSTTTYLINIDGNLVHSWESQYQPGQSVYLLENGNILRTAKLNNQTFKAGGSGGGVQEINWDGTLVWDFKYSNNQRVQHHDIEPLPNGHVLIIAWEFKTGAEAVAAGRNPGLLKEGALWPDCIIEVEPTGANSGNIVWEWHIWDHLIQDFDSTKTNFGVVADHPELLDLNYVRNPNNTKADWNHVNSVDYNAELDQIIISLNGMSEIFVIDHSTTTAEAAGDTSGNSGKGGDILYRWGNPMVYRAGNLNDRKFFSQHDAQWLESGLPGAGNIVIFNNGARRPDGLYSTVEEIIPPVDSLGNYFLTVGAAYGPADPIWSYSAENPGDFYSQNISGAQRLANGNTLICSGAKGRFFEVTPEQKIVWEYINPVSSAGPLTQGDTPVKNTVFRCQRYAPDYPGLAEKDLTPGGPIENYTTAINYADESNPIQFTLFQNYPNPFNPETTIQFELFMRGFVEITIHNTLGQLMRRLVNKEFSVGSHSIKWDGRNDLGVQAASGIYYFQLKIGKFISSRKMLLLR